MIQSRQYSGSNKQLQSIYCIGTYPINHSTVSRRYSGSRSSLAVLFDSFDYEIVVVVVAKSIRELLLLLLPLLPLLLLYSSSFLLLLSLLSSSFLYVRSLCTLIHVNMWCECVCIYVCGGRKMYGGVAKMRVECLPLKLQQRKTQNAYNTVSLCPIW